MCGCGCASANYSESCRQIWVKISQLRAYRTGTNWLNFEHPGPKFGPLVPYVCSYHLM